MTQFSTLAVSALGLAAAVAPAGATLAQGSPSALSDGVYRPADPARLQSADVFWGGRDYCWYDDAWRGPGWYWCGYGSRYGWGWGGPWGWNGWWSDRDRRFFGHDRRFFDRDDRFRGGRGGDHWRGGGWHGGGGRGWHGGGRGGEGRR